MTKRFDIKDDKAIKALSPAYPGAQLTDGAGLYLKLRWGQAQCHSWRFDFTSPEDGKRRTLTLGDFPALGLVAARKLADKARETIAQGECPSIQRRADERERKVSDKEAAESKARVKNGLPASGTAFRSVAAEFVLTQYDETRKKNDWTERRATLWTALLANHVFDFVPADQIDKVGDMELPDIKARHVEKIVKKIQGAGMRETARQVFTAMSKVFRYGIVLEVCETNPCDALRDHINLEVVPEHYPAPLKATGIAAALKKIDGYEGQGNNSMRDAFQMMSLTWQRPGNVRLMRWEELHLDGGDIEETEFTGPCWVIPSFKMKRSQQRKEKGDPHIVPLPKQAVEILKRRKAQGVTGPFVFGSQRNGAEAAPHGQAAMSSQFARMGFKDVLTPHGFRAMARTVLSEKFAFDERVLEAQLAHGNGQALGKSYDRATFIDERARAVQVWADYLDQLRKGADVVKIKPAARVKKAA